MTVGLGAAIVGQRIFRLGKNANLLGGMMFASSLLDRSPHADQIPCCRAGVGAGYLWSKASLDSYLAEAEREKELLVRSKREANPYEGGFGGQEEMKDQCAHAACSGPCWGLMLRVSRRHDIGRALGRESSPGLRGGFVGTWPLRMYSSVVWVSLMQCAHHLSEQLRLHVETDHRRRLPADRLL